MENKFVRSCQKNSKEVQEALFALGYTGFGGVAEVQYLEYTFVFTGECGGLTYSDHNSDKESCLYDFTEETKLVATLKPVNNELTELREQADALLAKIKEMEAKQCEV